MRRIEMIKLRMQNGVIKPLGLFQLAALVQTNRLTEECGHMGLILRGAG